MILLLLLLLLLPRSTLFRLVGQGSGLFSELEVVESHGLGEATANGSTNCGAEIGKGPRKHEAKLPLCSLHQENKEMSELLLV